MLKLLSENPIKLRLLIDDELFFKVIPKMYCSRVLQLLSDKDKHFQAIALNIGFTK